MTNVYALPWGMPALDRRIRAVQTTRAGGVSASPWNSLNLGGHVGDQSDAVLNNRAILSAHLPTQPTWLNQVHGTVVCDLDASSGSTKDGSAAPVADAAFSRTPGVVAAILTADCLPVLLANQDGSCVGAAHAGWRGLCDGVIEALDQAMTPKVARLAWLGPAIGPLAFQVGAEVRERFLDAAPAELRAKTELAFSPDPAQAPNAPRKFYADLYALARLRLERLGIFTVLGGHDCTFTDRERFFSYRRDGQTGRMATCIWIANED